MSYLRKFFLCLAFCFLTIPLAHSLNIDPSRYSIHFGDINEDGFTDVYVHGKEQFVPIGGEIFIPLILPPTDSFVLFRDTVLVTDRTVVDGLGGVDTFRSLVAQDTFAAPEFLNLSDSEVAALRSGVANSDFYEGDFNGDNATDLLIKSISDSSTGYILVSQNGENNNYQRLIASGLAFTLASTVGDTAPQILQSFNDNSLVVANLLTASISIQDVDADGRDDILLNNSGEQTIWFAAASGQIDTSQYQTSTNNVVKTASYTGTTAGVFRVNEKGAANYNIKLTLPTGTAGVQPELSIGYASNAGNGLLGKGWSLNGLSSVTRCGKNQATDNALSPIQLNGEDRFCLDGQRLIPVEGTTYGAVGSLYKTELDSFVKVMAVGGSFGAPNYFKVLRKDGSVTSYGQTTDSKQLAGTQVLSWAQNRISDSVGNAINFIYYNDVAGHRIQAIRYAYGLGTSHNSEVSFNYDNRPDDISGYIAGHKLSTSKRLQAVAINNYVNGQWQALRNYNLIYNPFKVDNALSLLSAVQECVEGKCLPATRFDWEEQELVATFESPTYIEASDPPGVDSDILRDRRSLDVNGDGYMDMVILSQNDDSGDTDEYLLRYFISDGAQLSEAHFSDGSPYFTFKDAHGKATNRYNDNVMLQVLDYNGDGRQDLALYRSQVGYWRVHLSVPSGDQWRLSKTPVNLTQLTNKASVFVDFDGNGLADAVSSSKIYYLKQSSSPTMEMPYAYEEANAYSVEGSNRIRFGAHSDDCSISYWLNSSFGDIDADGDMDLVASKYTRCQVSYSEDEGGNPIYSTSSKEEHAVVEWTGQGFVIRRIISDIYDRVNHEGVQLVDINGDGLADIVRSAKEHRRWYYSLSNGKGFEAERSIGEYSKFANVQFADINGDGKQDFVMHDFDNRQLRYRLFNGNTFGPWLNLRATNGSKEESHVVGDLNADGRVDYVRVYRTGRKQMNIQVYMATVTPQPENTITQISNGLGAVTQIHYESLAASDSYSTADFELSYLYQHWAVNPGALARGTCDEAGCANKTFSADSILRDFEQQQQGDMARGIWDLPTGSETLNAGEPVIPINGGVYVVSRVDSSSPKASDQAGNVNSTAKSAIAYQYSGARVQGGGRGFLGFQYLKTIDLQTDIKTTTLYRQDYPFTGAPQKTVTFSATDQVMQVSENTWGLKEFTGTDGTLYYQTLLKGSRETGYHVGGNNEQLIIGSNKVKEIIAQTEYDDEGNPTQIISTTSGFGDLALTETKTTTNNYGSGSLTIGPWGLTSRYAELGRLTGASVTTTLNGQTTTRATGFSYYTSGDLSGLLRSETVEPGGAQNAALTTTHYYNELGNKNRSVTRGWDGQAIVERSSRSEYDASGRYMNASYNYFDQRINTVLERNGYGSPIRTMDLSGITTTVQYDALGRETYRSDNLGAWASTEYLRCNQLGNCPAGTSYAMRKRAAGGAESIEYFDILGRSTRKGSINFDGRWVYTDVEYDNLSRPVHTSEPFYANTVPLWNMTRFDAIGRPWRMILADGTASSIRYGELSTTTINAFGQSKTETKNALDQLVMVRDHNGGRIGYEYNLDGELTRLHSYRAGSTEVAATTVLDYDALGRKTSMVDPDKGSWTYGYNAFGELIEQTDAKNQRVTQQYDRLGRMVKRTDYLANNSVEGHTAWHFDNTANIGPEFDNARGQLREVVSSKNTSHESCLSASTQQCISYSYDDHGRQISSDVQLGAGGQLGTYGNRVEYDTIGRVGHSYDALDSVVRLNGSSISSGVQTHYNNYGYAYRTTDIQTGRLLQQIEDHNQRGQVTEELKGNGARTYYNYDSANGRLLNQRTDVVGLFAIQDINYGWDALGNLESRHNQSANGQGGQKNLQESFCYDGLNRLIKANNATTDTSLCGGLSVNDQDMEYDSLGNITRKHDVGNYTYAHINNTAAANDAGLHAVTATSDGYTYHYDNNGNMIQDRKNGIVERALHYTSFDKPDQITKGDHTTKFAYGFDRSRYWREDNNVDGIVTTTLYLGGVERITKSNTSNIEWKRYLGDTIYTITTDASGNQQSSEALFVYKDHLGSTDVLTDNSGQVVQSMSFDAWGQRRNALTWDPLNVIQLASFDHSKSTKGFTGHEHLDEVGLIHMNGRIYDPRLARFLQADPHIQAPSDTQMLNRYSYVRNNPLNATDPSGYFLTMIVGAVMMYFGVSAAVTAIVIGMLTFVQALAAGASLGNAVKAGVIAGVSTYAFAKIGQYFRAQGNANSLVPDGDLNLTSFGGNELTGGQVAQQVALHGITGGVTAELQGGKFGHGFFSAGFTKGVMGAAGFNSADPSATDIAGQTALAATVGGTVSEVTGGKFRNGAETAAIAHLVNGLGARLISAAQSKIRIINKGLANGVHAKTGIRFNAKGFPIFDDVAKETTQIAVTGNRAKDEIAANLAVGLDKTPDGYVWHHVEDAQTMQLVPKAIHNAVGHSGGVAVKRALDGLGKALSAVAPIVNLFDPSYYAERLHGGNPFFDDPCIRNPSCS